MALLLKHFFYSKVYDAVNVNFVNSVSLNSTLCLVHLFSDLCVPKCGNVSSIILKTSCERLQCPEMHKIKQASRLGWCPAAYIFIIYQLVHVSDYFPILNNMVYLGRNGGWKGQTNIEMKSWKDD